MPYEGYELGNLDCPQVIDSSIGSGVVGVIVVRSNCLWVGEPL